MGRVWYESSRAMFSNIPILLTECPEVEELVSKYSKGFISKRNYYDFCNSIQDFYYHIISYKEINQKGILIISKILIIITFFPDI